MVTNTEGNLKHHIQEMWQKSNKMLLQINATGTKSRWEQEKLE